MPRKGAWARAGAWRGRAMVSGVGGERGRAGRNGRDGRGGGWLYHGTERPSAVSTVGACRGTRLPTGEAGSPCHGVGDEAARRAGGRGRDPCSRLYNSESARRPERASAGRKDRRAGSSSPRRFRRADDGQQDRGRMGRGGALRWQSRPQWHVRLGGRCHLPGEWVGRRRRVSPATRVRREKACPTGSRTGRDASS